MSARRISRRHVLPENPTFIEFIRSDGDERLWPTNTTYVVDHEGHVNFMQPLDLDSSVVIQWRVSVGNALAIELEMPEGPDYVLKDWPAGYRPYDHQKGIANSPRHDIYVFGSPKGRFRSINEFIPHAIWLMRDASLNPSNCSCKYCSKKAQKEITASMGNILRATPSSQSSTPSRPRPPRDRIHTTREILHKNRERQRENKVYAAVQKVPKPLRSAKITKYPMLVERNQDLRAVHSKTEMKLKRWFREGELLWCALDPPIEGPKGDGDVIKFWPGLVDEAKLKNEAIPRRDGSCTPDQQGGSSALNEDAQEDVTLSDGAGPSTPWTVRQSTVYKMQLLGVSHTYLAADDQVLPYQAYIPPTELIQAMQAISPSKLDFNRGKLSNFNPCPGDQSPNFEDACAPYAMAVQIGATLSGFWCLTDEWDFKYTVKTTIPRTRPPPQSLQSAIEAAGMNNAMRHIHDYDSISTALPFSSRSYQGVSGASHDLSKAELQETSNRILGVQPAPLQTLTQVRFQGLWWGAERIWTDEFVRLKVPRRCLAPKGAQNIRPPSPAGKSARERWEALGKDPAELGAGTRGVFMRLDGLFIVDAVQKDGGTKKECRASGMLYELADLDWEDPEVKMPEAAVDGGPRSGVSASASSSSMPAPPPPLPPLPRTLPNFDPSVPIAATTSSVLAQTNPSNLNPISPVNGQLSHPAPSTHYHLPQAPIGYRFRPILSEGHEAVVSLSLISGRYYPRILSHPLLDSVLQRAITHPIEQGGLMESNNLWALEGLSAGFYNSVDPTQYKITRSKMVEDADRAAAAALETHKQERVLEEIRVKEERSMMVDDGLRDELDVMDVDDS